MLITHPATLSFNILKVFSESAPPKYLWYALYHYRIVQPPHSSSHKQILVWIGQIGFFPFFLQQLLVLLFSRWLRIKLAFVYRLNSSKFDPVWLVWNRSWKFIEITWTWGNVKVKSWGQKRVFAIKRLFRWRSSEKCALKNPLPYRCSENIWYGDHQLLHFKFVALKPLYLRLPSAKFFNGWSLPLRSLFSLLFVLCVP